ncbi:hypothetical protein [Pseudoalteromonas sp. T1lg88]|uniref:hypothetical protein n=1 Tax=Pseudoalteromonas sp. T1lg88 TaxID=2077104 RepID=UPI000CF5F4E4|nr:hypothetical protein [Pseudoalteromonas sp. T1lg88]
MLLVLKKHALLAGVATTAMIVGTFAIQSGSSLNSETYSQCVCDTNAYGEQTQDCANPDGEQSWFAWFAGDSRSAQFHYLDLLELLSRNDNKENARQFSNTSY